MSVTIPEPQSRDEDISLEVLREKLRLLQRTRPYTVLLMMFGTAIIYLSFWSLNLGYMLNAWLICILSIDCYRLYSTYRYHQRYRQGEDRPRHDEVIILINSLLSALAWGYVGAVLFPLGDTEAKLIAGGILVGIATAATTTLSYHLVSALSFVSVIVVLFMVGLVRSEALSSEVTALYVFLLGLYMLFLIKNILFFHRNLGELLYLRAVSEEREAELSVQREMADQANQAKTDFLSNMSHELRSPMHAILGFSELGSINIDKAPRDKLAGYFTRIRDSGQSLLGLLNDLLDLSKLESGRMQFDIQEHSLKHTVDVVLEEFAPLFDERSLMVEFAQPDFDTGSAYDEDRIVQVIRNLLSNAIRYSPPGKNLMLDLSETTLLIERPDNETMMIPSISLSVTDEGIGIPEDELQLVFDKFVQSSKTRTNAGGTGLGLSICKEIMHQHAGEIKAANHVRHGAVFTITLPRKPVPVPEAI